MFVRVEARIDEHQGLDLEKVSALMKKALQNETS
jgi:hypothetical protein